MDIFVSRPTNVDPEFESGLRSFYQTLKLLDLTPRTIGVSDQPIRSPLDEVIELLHSCQGIIVLGYPQILVQKGYLKTRRIEKDLRLATEWNHIEASLAYALGLPMLVIHHQGVCRGIFDRGAIGSFFLYETNMTYETWAFEQNISGALEKWKGTLTNAKVGSFKASQKTHQQPMCPNCPTIMSCPSQ